jgi:hypothetical protein
MYTSKSSPPYPFATLFKATPDECIPELLSCLPKSEELLEYLDSFEKRVRICAFPHIPTEITRSEVERFLSDAKHNAKVCPDMLALLFAALALGVQHSAWDKSGKKWNAETTRAEQQKGNVYSQLWWCIFPVMHADSRSSCRSHASSAHGFLYAQTHST